jgi:DNA-binding response OmpR family regulator
MGHDKDNIYMKNILIVEDSKAQAELLAMAIKQFGYNSVITHSVEEAKVILEHENKFDLITLDVNMAGVSGIIFLSELREAGVTIPIIIMSAVNQKDSIARALDIGASEYITKPISLKILRNSLEKYLD